MENKSFPIFIIAFALLSSVSLAETALMAKSGASITFNASAMEPFSNLSFSNASWDFADDTTSDGMVVEHSFTYDGVYRINVTADVQGSPKAELAVIVGGSVPFVSDSASYVAMYFSNFPNNIYNLSVSQGSSTALDTTGFYSVGKFFEISSNLSSGSFNTTLIFSYDDENDDGLVDGINVNENSLDVYYYSGAWILVKNPVKDTVANTITVNLDHFTTFALLSTTQNSVPSAPPQGGGSSPSGSSGSSGGSSGGGAASGTSTGTTAVNTSNTSTSGTAEPAPAKAGCTPDPICSDWSSCVDGQQSRKCIDKNGCTSAKTETSSCGPIHNGIYIDPVLYAVPVAIAVLLVVFLLKKKFNKKSNKRLRKRK
ncbi:MAG: PKD domain-containing protein [Candidatus Aenigmatarchaeota archaeon]